MGFINVCLEIKGRGGCGGSHCGVTVYWKPRGISLKTVELFLVGGLLWFNDNC